MNVLPLPLPARRSRLRTLLRYGVIALVVVVAGLFFARRQIGDLLARKLDERLSAAGIYRRVAVRRLASGSRHPVAWSGLVSRCGEARPPRSPRQCDGDQG